ncbi:Cytochrome P450 monooxygenase [Rhizoctonia solani]|uniref:Cytochrome P450 monooxygenase n=1 Tax=Rhizoctonia solani TaxID=456999 RepID=A0A8H7I711_9AGAM|nr:Cytochrome P450 monooxygenase [Rhizoctonia solani]
MPARAREHHQPSTAPPIPPNLPPHIMSAQSVQPIHCAAALGSVALAYYLLPYLHDPHEYRRRFSGPLLASLSGWWMSYTCLTKDQNEHIRQLHQKYGTFVRIGPNHISISDPDAMEAVYAHGSGLLKSDFYGGAPGQASNTFVELDKSKHLKLRKRIANIFSQQNVLTFQPRVKKHIAQLCAQLDLRCREAARGVSGFNWTTHNGFAVVDFVPSFRISRSMLLATWQLELRSTDPGSERLLSIVGSSDETGQKDKGAVQIPVIAAMASFNTLIVAVQMFPLWARNIVKLLPWYVSGFMKQIRFFGLVAAIIEARLKRGSNEEDGPDFIDKFLEAKNEDGTGMTADELRSETSVMLLAGSDTSSKYACLPIPSVSPLTYLPVPSTLSSLFYHLAIHPDMQRKLQNELDEHLPPIQSEDSDDKNGIAVPPNDIVPDYNDIKNLPYLNACIKEVLRVHSTIGTGLPRIVPEGKTLTVAGQTFKRKRD